MDSHDSSKPFTATVEAGFTEDGTWLIDARLRFRDGPPELGSDLLGEGRLALLRGIAREVERGRSSGAARVRVHMEGHEGDSASLGKPATEPEDPS